MSDTLTAPPAAQKAAGSWRGGAPPAPGARAVLQSTAVAVVGLLSLVAAGKATGFVLLTPPLAATAVIIAGVPAAPPAQPRSVLVGHVSSAALGLLVVAGFGASPWTIAIAGALSLTVMTLARAVHAPAAATAALAVAQHPAVLRTLGSLIAGCALLILTGYVAGALPRNQRYPRYWW